MIARITDKEVEQAAASAQRVVEIHRRLADFLRVGQTLAEIDRFIADQLDDLDAKSCFLGYKAHGHPPFPSHACLSLNETVVHGFAGAYTKPLKPGDLLKIDIGVLHDGWIGDAAWTYAFEHTDDQTLRLMQCGKESLRRGISKLRPPNAFIEWAKEVQGCVESEYRFHLVRGLGGHGYGRKLHARPYISNTVPLSPGEWPDAWTPCTPGTLVAVEPMIAVGTGLTHHKGREWPIRTADGSQSVHYEHDVLITDDEPMVLTEGLDALPNIVGA